MSAPLAAFLFLTLSLAAATTATPVGTVLPTFDLTALNGQKVTSLPLTGQWLIVYIRPHCQACDTVLHLMKRTPQHPNLPSHLVIIGEMSVADLTQASKAFPDLSGAKWYADTSHHVLAQLHLSGTPIVLGVQKQTIQWSINGLLANSSRQLTLLESWTK